uniref:Nonstructural polyprotein n=1 Tax=Hepeviridae sp. TaxID=2715178 RepID=A0A6M3YPL1_9VIRU|nr:MAG: nonstructural polyprotein [Hepeviridae sp.]
MFRNAATVLEIGPNVTSFLKTTNPRSERHACCLYTGRDQIRYRDAANSAYICSNKDRKINTAVNKLASGLASETFCTQGFQNCHYQSPVGYSVHSLYDIDPKDLATGFNNHNMHTVYAYMHQVPAMLVTDEFTDERNAICFKVINPSSGGFSGELKKFIRNMIGHDKLAQAILYDDVPNLLRKPVNWLRKNLKGTKILMGFPGDDTFCYEHEYSNVLFYTQYGGLQTPYGFSLLFERIQNYGSQYLIKISKVTLDITTYHFTNLKLDSIVRIPDIVALAQRDFKAGQPIPVVWYDASKIRKLFVYLMGRKDKEFTLENAINYGRTELRSIIVKNEVIEYAWNLDINDFDRMITCVYVMVYLEKHRMLAIINSAIKEINLLMGHRSLWKKFKDMLKNKLFHQLIHLFESIGEIFGAFSPDLIIDSNYKLSLFSQLVLDTYGSIMNRTTLKTDNYCTEFFPNFLNEEEEEDDEKAVKKEVHHPTKTVEPPIKIEEDVKIKVYGKLINHGGDGDCFYRAYQAAYADTTDEMLAELPSEWVDYLDALTCCKRLGRELSILVRHGKDDAVYTTNTTAAPKMALVVAEGSDRGHYYEIGAGPDLITEATCHVPLSGGASTIHLVAMKINLTEDQDGIVVNAVKPTHRTTDTLNGFAAQVAENSLEGVNKYMEVLVANSINKRPWFISKLANGDQVLNIIAADTKTALIRLREFMATVKSTKFVAPLFGAGDWNRNHLTEDLLLLSLAPEFYEIEKSNVAQGNNLTLYTEVTENLPPISAPATPEESKPTDHAQPADDSSSTTVSAVLGEGIHSEKYIPPHLNLSFVNKTAPSPSNARLRFRKLTTSSLKYNGDANEFARALFNIIKAEDQDNILKTELTIAINEANVNGAKSLSITTTMALEALLKTKFNQPLFPKISGRFGVPGCGKTNQLIEGEYLQHQPDQIMYIAPTNELAQTMAAKAGSMQRSLTLHRALGTLSKRSSPIDLIILDEAFTVPLPYIYILSAHCRQLLLLGDPKQIGFIDFAGVWGGSKDLSHIYQLLPHEYNMVSYRIPRDIVEIPFMQKMYPGIVTRSAKNGSKRIPRPKQEINGVHMVFTREMKTRYATHNPITVHEAQGGTFPSVILHYDNTPGERDLISRSPAHAVVALTRHTNNLYIVENEPGKFDSVIMMLGDLGVLEGKIESSDITPITAAVPELVKPEAVRVTELAPAQNDNNTTKTGAQHVDDLLEKIFPIDTELEEYVATEATDLGGFDGGHMRVNLCKLNETKEKKPLKRFPIKSRVFNTDASRRHKIVQTMMDRYTKRTKQLSDQDLAKQVRELTSVADFVIGDYNVDPELRSECFKDAIKAYQEAGHDVTELDHLEWWRDAGNDKVKFMMKHQQKPDLLKNPLTKSKAGQGIAAWSKNLNFFVNVWTRVLEAKLRASNHIIFSSGKTDTEMLQILDAKCRDRNLQYLAVDWTEFDSSQNNLEHALLRTVLGKLGAPLDVLDIIDQMKHTRYVENINVAGTVHSKKDSGAPDTLVGNTLFNLCVVLSCVDNYRQLEIAAFKGDDAILAAPNLIINSARLQWLENNANYKLKLERADTGEFTTFILTSHGAAINLPRIAAKVFTRAYINDEHFGKYVTAVEDLTKTLRAPDVLYNMAEVNAVHFRPARRHVDTELFELLAENIRAFAAGQYKFKDLLDCEGFVWENHHCPHPLPILSDRVSIE